MAKENRDLFCNFITNNSFAMTNTWFAKHWQELWTHIPLEHNSEPTPTRNNREQVDYILTEKEGLKNTLDLGKIPNTGISDHELIHCTIAFSRKFKKQTNPQPHKYRNSSNEEKETP